MKKRGTKANLFLLDACREIKYNRGGSTTSEIQKYANKSVTVYAYATAIGHTADDGDDGHGKDMVDGGGNKICTLGDCQFVPCPAILLPTRIN